MSEKKFTVGEFRTFHNAAHYPTLDGQAIEILSEPWNEDEFISVRFVATNERMAARLWEIGMKL
jgi:hypothetical protein